MICPFSRTTGQAVSSCRTSCQLWVVTIPRKGQAKLLGECTFQLIARRIGLAIDELHEILHPDEVKDPFADDDRIVLCPGCGKVKQLDATWKFPKMGPKRDTWRPETCPECLAKELKDIDGE